MKELSALIRIVAPFAPHIAEELWHSKLNEKKSVHTAEWPTFDDSIINDEGITIGVQVNGKVRADMLVMPEMSEADVRTAVLALEPIQKYIPNPAEIKKFIYVKGKIISIVV
jgi:leucyl-tRNA synthetase